MLQFQRVLTGYPKAFIPIETKVTGYLLFAFLLQCLALTMWGLSRRDRIYQYPFLAALVFGLWAWPQVYGVWHSQSVEAAWLNRVIVMSMLCLGAAFVGNVWESQGAPRPVLPIDRRRLLQGALVLTLIGLA